jgi:hypothetical protein
MSWTITPQTKVPVDPQYGSVSLLLHGNGTNGSTTITDNSPTPKTVTAVGNAQISTAQSKFGGSSILLDGTGDNLDLAAISFADSENFTLECFLYKNAGGYGNVFGGGSGTQIGYDLSAAPGTSTGTIYMYFAGGFGVSASGTAVTLNTWNHLAWTRQGSTCRAFVNGILQGSGTRVDAFSFSVIGASASGGAQAVNGYIDDLRITKGIARYTSNFTPPAAPFPDI